MHGCDVIEFLTKQAGVPELKESTLGNINKNCHHAFNFDPIELKFSV